MTTARASTRGCQGRFLVLASALILPAFAQAPKPAITLDPPTGWELQVHAYNTDGTARPASPANYRYLGEAQAGELADLHTLTLRFAESTKLTDIQSTKDFRIEQGGSCVEGNTYSANTTCTLLVRFTPQGPGRRLGRLTVSHSGSPAPITLALGGSARAPIVSFIPAQITTLPASYPSSKPLVNYAINLAVDGSDSLYVADRGNNAIRMMDSTASFQTISSTGTKKPWGVAADSFGWVWFSQPDTNQIYSIDIVGQQSAESGTGTDTCTSKSPPCALWNEKVYQPGPITISANDTMFFTDNSGGAAMSQLLPIPPTFMRLTNPIPYSRPSSSPGAMAWDSDFLFSAYIYGNKEVCQILALSLEQAKGAAMSFTKVAGTRACGFSGDGGKAGNARISDYIGQITFDTAHNLYFTDSTNHRIRRIESSNNVIRTIAGNGTAGYAGDGGPATNATLMSPTGVAVDSQGAVYVLSVATAANWGQVIRKIGPDGYLRFPDQVKATTSPTTFVTVTNTGNNVLVFTKATITGTNAADFKIDSTLTTCNFNSYLTFGSGQSCRIGIVFTPPATGTRTANLILSDNTFNGADKVILSGRGILPNATLKITSPTAGQSFRSGTAVPFTLSVTSPNTPAPGGAVQFKVDGANYGGPIAVASGKASVNVAGLTVASHTLSATYSGDANYAPGGPVSVSITVTSGITVRPPFTPRPPLHPVLPH